MVTGLLQLLLWHYRGGGTKSSGRFLVIEGKDGLFYIGLSYMMHWKRQHPVFVFCCILNYLERVLFLILFILLYTFTSCPFWNDSVWMVRWSLCGVFPYQLSGLCWVACVCGPCHSTTVWMDRVCKAEQQQSNNEHLCVSGSGTGSLNQGGVKVKAEMGEREKKAERGWDELSHWEQTIPSVPVLVWRKQSVSGRVPMNSALESLHYPLRLQAPWSASLSLPGLWPLETFVLQLSLPEYKRVFSIRLRLVCQWV